MGYEGIKVEMIPPGSGCNNCGAWADEPDHIKLKRLRFDGSDWLCFCCRKEQHKGGVDG